MIFGQSRQKIVFLGLFLALFLLAQPVGAAKVYKEINILDSDKDGLPDNMEVNLGTDLHNLDSDADGFFDGVEVKKGYDPLSNNPTKLAKRIAVSLKEQRLRYYLGDKMVDSFLISGGTAGWPTPQGNFQILLKKSAVNYGGEGFGYNYPNTKWNLMFFQNKNKYYIHGAYWHNNFGKPMSHGCVNVSYQNMPFLYDWADVGTPVLIEKGSVAMKK